MFTLKEMYDRLKGSNLSDVAQEVVGHLSELIKEGFVLAKFSEDGALIETIPSTELSVEDAKPTDDESKTLHGPTDTKPSDDEPTDEKPSGDWDEASNKQMEYSDEHKVFSPPDSDPA